MAEVPWYIKVRTILAGPKRAVLKQQRLAYLKKRYPNGRISTHFAYREFFCRDGMPYPTRAADHLEWYVKNVLEPMRTSFGACQITSPYRHYYYNLNIGGAKDSRHDWDKHPTELACDLVFASGAPVLWAERAAQILARLKVPGGIGVYNQPLAFFVHIDTRRPEKGRWWGSRTQPVPIHW